MHKSTPFVPSCGVFVWRVFVAVFSFPPHRVISGVPNCIIFGEESERLQQGMEKQQAFDMSDCKAQAFSWALFQNVNNYVILTREVITTLSH